MWCYTLFPKILNMSLTAGIVIVLVLLARLLLRKAPKIFSYALWAVVLFRLLCPVSFSSDFLLLGVFHSPTVTDGSITYIPTDIVHMATPQVDLPLPGVSDAINDTLPYGEEQLAADPLEWPMAAATMLWLFGIAAMLIYSSVSLLLLHQKLIGAVRLRKNIYLADHISTPFVIGVIHPKIYLPSTLSERERDYIILHEQTHIRRLDHITKLVSFLALTLHWFNPLVWVAFILSGKDMEMSCDEAVLKKMDKDIRADYSASLLSLATGRKIIAGTPLAFGEGDTKSRIKNVMDYKKPAFWVLIICVVAVITLCALLLFNPKQDSNLFNLNQDNNLFGTTYQVKEVLYVDVRYSFAYTKETAPLYSITDDNTILEKENIPGVGWIGKGNLYPVTYSQKELYALFFGSLDNYVSTQLDEAGTIYRIDTESDAQKFYLIMQTNSGEILIAVGYGKANDSHVRWLYRMEPCIDISARYYDVLEFSDLPPQESKAYTENLNFTADSSEFYYHVAWVRAGLYIDVGLVAQDGTEYLDTVRGGSEIGTIDNIPAGSYQVIVRNSEKNLEYLEPATETLNIEGSVYFGYVEEWQPLEAANASVKPEEIVVDDLGSNEEIATAWMRVWFNMYKALPGYNMAYITEGVVDRLDIVRVSKEGLPKAFVFSVTFSVRPTYPIAGNVFWMAGNTGNSPGRDETWGQMYREVELRQGDDDRYHFVSMGTGGIGNGSDYEDISQPAAESWELIGNADVNRDGLKEAFYLDKSHMDSGPWVTLRVCDDSGNEIWSEDAGIPHVGWNSLFLCEQEGKYCLLRYHPTMYQGYCSYVYTLFTLEGGAEHVVRSNTIEFDVNGVNKLNAPKMVAFAEEVNVLLGKSTLLLSSESGNYSFGPSSADQFFERYSWLDETSELYADGDDLKTRLVKYSEYAVSNYRLHNS
ncbi:MAG: M56 family metallopeptidase [Dehalobacterium sp.]